MLNHVQFGGLLVKFKLKASCLSCHSYRHITWFDIELQPGERVKNVERYSDELALAVGSYSKPIFKVLSEIGILRIQFSHALPNKDSIFKLFKRIQDNPAEMSIYDNFEIPCVIGESFDGKLICFDIARNPHMLIGGAAGSGKSSLLHTIVLNVLASSKNVCYLIDTKNVEFSVYKNIKNTFVAFNYDKALEFINYLNNEMERRYLEMANENLAKNNGKFANIVCIIDEFSDLISQDVTGELRERLCILAQKSRACGIFIVIATQRPSVEIVKGNLKANFPARISCKVASSIDSKVILDSTGAENLFGQGDAIINNYNFDCERFQVAYASRDLVSEMIG